MKILVTGGAGFIGSHLVDRLIKENHKVAVIDNLSAGRRENLNKKAKFYQLDILDSEVSEIFKKEKPEAVFHFAAQIDVRKSVKNPVEDAKINILGTLNILENCRKISVKKSIFASSGGAIYGDTDIVPTPETHPENPESPYGIAKLTVEKYLYFYQKTFSLNYIALRLANVYGPRQNSKGEGGVIAIFCDKMLRNEQPVINGDGTQTRDFIFVADVVNVALKSLTYRGRASAKSGLVYNVGTGKETNINEIFRKIKELTGSDCQEIHGPAKLGEQKRSCLDYSKAKEELNWQPKYSLEEGLRETIRWFRKKIKS